MIFFLSFRLKLFCSFLAALFDAFVSTERKKFIFESRLFCFSARRRRCTFFSHQNKQLMNQRELTA